MRHRSPSTPTVLALAVLLALGGCSDDDPGTPAGPGTIVIDASPDALQAPWTLTGPGGFSEAGTGDATFDDLAAGDYVLAWQPVSGRITPATAHVALAGGATETCAGLYEQGAQPGPEGTDVWITSKYDSRDDHRLRVGGWADFYYTMIRFDLTGLPATVSSAEIRLYCWGNDAAANVSMTLHRVTGAWSEASTWQTQPTTEELGPLAMPALGAWYAIDVTDLYNAWQAGTYENRGIQLRPTANDHKFNEFHSSDYVDDVFLRPKLVIVP